SDLAPRSNSDASATRRAAIEIGGAGAAQRANGAPVEMATIAGTSIAARHGLGNDIQTCRVTGGVNPMDALDDKLGQVYAGALIAIARVDSEIGPEASAQIRQRVATPST